MKENDEEENDMKLGLSVYPEQESPEQIETYLKTGAEYGFDHVFTSIFSVDGTKEEIVSYFRNLTDMAHRLGYVVDGDVNTWFLKRSEPVAAIFPYSKKWESISCVWMVRTGMNGMRS